MNAPARRDSDHLTHLFADLRPRLEAVLRRYEIPAADAGRLLETAAIDLTYKGGEIEEPEAWLVARLRRACRRFWVARRCRIAAAVGRVFAARSTTVPIEGADHAQDAP